MSPTPTLSWRQALAVYCQRPVLGMVLLGFSAGLPFLLVFSTLSAWLTEAGVTRSAIGFFAWVGMTYSIKVLWAPVVDRLKPPLLGKLLGQRRSWIALGQLGIITGLLGMSLLDPAEYLAAIAAMAVLVAFSSSTQDVAIDAYRIEAAADEIQGAMSAAYILGYRLALLMAGAGALYLADLLSWSLSYQAMAACMLIGLAAVLWLPEPERQTDTSSNEQEVEQLRRVLGADKILPNSRWQRWFLVAVLCPFVEFFRRNGRFALLILLFIGVFRLSDITMGIMANPFYLDLGFSKSEIASIAKVFGFFMTIAGSALCGLLVVKWGIYRPLLLGAILVSATNLLFAALAEQSAPSLAWLALVISADNLSGGIASTAFVAYLSSLTNRNYTATQYALFSSLMTLPGKFISGFSGVIVDDWGYSSFFIMAAAAGLPAILLAVWLLKRERRLPR